MHTYNLQKNMYRIELVKDNLEFIKELINNGVALDLIYIDPPFNKGKDFGAFNDNFSKGNIGDSLEFQRLMPEFYSGLIKVCPNPSTLNYIITMGVRCWYMRELLKDTGSFYYHCDDTVGHYVRVLLDYIFSIDNFRNVITWKRTHGSKAIKYNYPRNSDFIFFYTKSNSYTFNPCYKELSKGGLSPYRYKDEKGRVYRLDNVNAPPPSKGIKEWVIDGKIITHPNGKGFAWTQETLDRKRKEHFEKYGTELIHISSNGVPQQMRYLENSKGAIIDNMWIDIGDLNGTNKERLGYPTQKPEALLERIILASSNPGDLVGDFYLGSGTTGAVAIKNNRGFVGCDINKQAVNMAKERVSNLTK